MDVDVVLWIIIGVLTFGIGGIMAFLFGFKPEILVRRQAVLYNKIYKKQFNLSDEEIDRKVRPFSSLFMIDSMSDYINRGISHPEEFPKLIRMYRAVGCFMWAILTITVLLLGALIFTGGLSIAR